MKKVILLTALFVAGTIVAVKAQTAAPASAAQQKAQFTPEEEAKLQYISKQQEMAANFYRKNVSKAQSYYQELIGLMDGYIAKTTDAAKQAKMKDLRDKVKASGEKFEDNFSDIYSNSKMFITLL